MKRVLIISYRFGANDTIGAIRMMGLCKNLPEFGWEPTVITISHGEASTDQNVVETRFENLEEKWKSRLLLLGDHPARQENVKSNDASLFGRLLWRIWQETRAFPDLQTGWFKHAVEAGATVLSEGRTDVLLSSSKPATSHLVASELKREFGVPWVADFRDLWTQNSLYPYSKIRNMVEQKLEVATISRADALTTVSRPLADQLSMIHRARPIVVIPNGFDLLQPTSSGPLTDRFRITYTGSLYNGIRSPKLLFSALSELIGSGTIDRAIVAVEFFGPDTECISNLVGDFSLEDIVKLRGFVTREEAMEAQRQAQILLLLPGTRPEDLGVYTGKVFEYLASRRPILSIGGPMSVIAGLLESTATGIHAVNQAQVVQFLRKAYSEFASTGTVAYHGVESEISKYSHREMARSFSSVLDRMSERRT